MPPADSPSPQSPLAGSPRVRSLPAFAREEFDALCRALSRRVKEGSIPPEDAYWWARMLCSEPHLEDLLRGKLD